MAGLPLLFEPLHGQVDAPVKLDIGRLVPRPIKPFHHLVAVSGWTLHVERKVSLVVGWRGTGGENTPGSAKVAPDPAYRVDGTTAWMEARNFEALACCVVYRSARVRER